MIALRGTQVIGIFLHSLRSSVAAHNGFEGQLAFPTSLKDMKHMSSEIEALFQSAPVAFMLTFAWLYLFVQAFAIPGSFLLNIIAGSLFGEIAGLLLVACMAACGASCCYGLSMLAGASLTQVSWLAPRLGDMRAAVAQAKRKGALFWYMLSLRLFPVTPNYIVNITSPWVGVPLGMFWLTMAVGLSPYNYATVAAGATLKTLQDDYKPMNISLFIKLCFIALIALLPALCKSRVQQLGGSADSATSVSTSQGATAAVLPSSPTPGVLRRTAGAHSPDAEQGVAAAAVPPDSWSVAGLQHTARSTARYLAKLLSSADKEQAAD